MLLWHAAAAAFARPSIRSCAALCRPAVTLVCKRWHRVFYATPALWRRLVIAVPRPPPLLTQQQWADLPASLGQWVDARAALLARVAGMVEALELQNGDGLKPLGGGGQLARLLRCLRPQAARGVKLDAFDLSLPEAAMQSLAALTGLTHLELVCDKLHGSAAAALLQLGATLRRLQLLATSVPAEVADALPLLSQLTHLDVWFSDPQLPADWRSLTALVQLQRLRLWLARRHDGRQLQPPLPAAFAALSDFRLFAEGRSLQASRGCRRTWRPSMFWDGPALLPRASARNAPRPAHASSSWRARR